MSVMADACNELLLVSELKVVAEGADIIVAVEVTPEEEGHVQ